MYRFMHYKNIGQDMEKKTEEVKGICLQPSSLFSVFYSFN